MLFKHQVLLKDLKNPICVAVFDNDGPFGEFTQAAADKLRGDLEMEGIDFAAVDHEPPIKIFVGKADLGKLNKSGIKLPTVYDQG